MIGEPQKKLINQAGGVQPVCQPAEVLREPVQTLALTMSDDNRLKFDRGTLAFAAYRKAGVFENSKLHLCTEGIHMNVHLRLKTLPSQLHEPPLPTRSPVAKCQ